MKNLKKRLLLIIKLLVAVSLIFLLFTQIEFQKVVNVFRDGNYGLLLLAFLIFTIAFCGFFSYRFHVLVKPVTKSFWKSFRFTAIGFFFNNFLPTNIGGDGIKLYLLRQEAQNDTWGKGLSYIFTERFIGFATILLAWIVYTPFFFDIYAGAYGQFASRVNIDSGKLGFLSIMIFVFIIIIIFIFALRNKGIGKRIISGMHDFANKLREISVSQLAKATFYSVLFHLFRGLGFYVLLIFFGAEIAPVHMIFILFMSTFIGFLPVSVGALGTLETAIVLSLVIFNVPEEIALAMALFYRLFLILFSLLGGVIYMAGKSIR